MSAIAPRCTAPDELQLQRQATAVLFFAVSHQ